MRNLVLLGLTAALCVSAFVVADETAPDCETNQKAGQGDKISERSAPLRSGQGSGACEGEQWDGQDSVNQNTAGVNAGAAGNQPNINDNGPQDALHLRVSAATSGAAYARTDIFGVGAAAAYTDGTTSAVYLQDYSDSLSQATGLGDEYMLAYNAAHDAAFGTTHDYSDNWLAGAVHLAHITQGENFGEESPSCTQDAGTSGASYADGTCNRDNTAVTVELVP